MRRPAIRTRIFSVSPLQKGPIDAILHTSVTVVDGEGREYAGVIEFASAARLDVRYTTGHKGQFSQVRHFRRRNLRGYEAQWSVRELPLGAER